MSDDTSTAAATAAAATDDFAQPANAADGANDDFDTAFSEAAGDKTERASSPPAAAPAQETPAPTQADAGTEATEPDKSSGSTEAASTAKAAPAPDIWAKASPELKAAFEAAVAQSWDWELRARSDAGRISAYQKQVQDLQKQLGQLNGNLPATDGETDPDSPGSSAVIRGALESDEFKQFSTDYPEVAKPMSSLIRALASENAKLAAELSGISEEYRAQNLADQEAFLASKHPDWEDITASPQFLGWANAQPPFVRDALIRNADQIVNGEEAAHVLNLYKLEAAYRAAGNGQPQPKVNGQQQPAPAAPAGQQPNARRAAQLDSARSTTSKGPVVSATPADDFESAFQHYAGKK